MNTIRLLVNLSKKIILGTDSLVLKPLNMTIYLIKH